MNTYIQETVWVRRTLIGLAFCFMVLFLVLPLGIVFYEALKDGMGAFLGALSESESLHAIKLTLTVLAIVLPINVFFGLAIAWLITRHHFFGKSVLTTLLDIPLAVSPVVAGLMFLLVFGANSTLGSYLLAHDIKVVFALPALVIATLFVTFSLMARELIPTLQSLGDEEEQAALTLGANGLQLFWHITLPNIKWAMLYGVLLTSARAMGEFGAVSVVSGHIRGQTNTMPLLIEIAYNDYAFTTAFALSVLLSLFSLLVLALQSFLGHKTHTKS